MPIVNTTLGPILGAALLGGGGVDQFLGVPYGNAQRFRAATVWSTPYATRPLNALTFGPACFQFLTSNTTYGQEHGCLIANIWRPSSAAPADKLPILVYVPGGENAFGEAGPYNASQLAADQRAVVVGINYRVGAFGFLAFAEDHEAGEPTGHYALSDIQAALQWIKREGSAFGGDPSRLTLVGQNSGGGLVLMHAFAPSSAGLVQGLLAQSGSVGAVALATAVASNTQHIARECGCAARGFTSIRRCLEATDAAQIVFAQGVHCVTPNVCSLSTTWSPVADGVFLPRAPSEMLAAGKVNPGVSVVMGANTNDTNLFVSGVTTSLPFPVPAFVYQLALRVLSRKGAHGTYERLLRLYPPHRHRPFANHSDRLGWVFSDAFLCSTLRTARSFATAGAATFVYRHDHFFQSNEVCTAVPNYHAPSLGALHQDELSFVFGQPIFMDLGGTPALGAPLNCSVAGSPYFDRSCVDCVFSPHELGYARSVGRFWTNFGATGDPNRRSAASATDAQDAAADAHDDEDEWPRVVANSSAARDVHTAVLRPERPSPLSSSSAAGLFTPTRRQRMASEVGMGRAEKCAVWDSLGMREEELEAAMAEVKALFLRSAHPGSGS